MVTQVCVARGWIPGRLETIGDRPKTLIVMHTRTIPKFARVKVMGWDWVRRMRGGASAVRVAQLYTGKRDSGTC